MLQLNDGNDEKNHTYLIRSVLMSKNPIHFSTIRRMSPNISKYFIRLTKQEQFHRLSFLVRFLLAS